MNIKRLFTALLRGCSILLILYVASLGTSFLILKGGLLLNHYALWKLSLGLFLVAKLTVTALGVILIEQNSAMKHRRTPYLIPKLLLILSLILGHSAFQLLVNRDGTQSIGSTILGTLLLGLIFTIGFICAWFVTESMSRNPGAAVIYRWIMVK